MKNALRVGLVSALVVTLFTSVFAFAATFRSVGGETFNTGVTIGETGTLIADSYAATLTTNFTGIAANTCKVSAAITVTGAAASDPCFVGADATNDALNVLFTCHVSASNAVKIKICNQTGSDITNLASATFNVRVMDP